MSRLLLLAVIIVWMCRSLAPTWRGPLSPEQGAIVFIGGLALVTLFLGLWSRVVARNVRSTTLQRNLRRFHHSILTARMLIPVWFAVAVFLLGWPNVVRQMLGPIKHWPIELPGLLIGTMPAFLAWMALWWAQYPADCALREQSFLLTLENDLPVRRTSSFREYFVANLRLQILFTIVPVVSILLLRDLVMIALDQFFGVDLRSRAASSSDGAIELITMLLAIKFVVLLMPELLRRVLATEPLPQGPLRQRLEELCQRTGLRYRDILLWNTNYNMGNAAVMGLVPRFRYILLSDVLLETMTDKQIEAVFAHELGHVKYRHMAWYLVLIVTIMLVGSGPGQVLSDRIANLHLSPWLTSDALSGVAVACTFGMALVAFGLISRWFERQADVFAARTIQNEANDIGQPALVGGSHVGPHGATVFASALHRVAVINNIPVSAGNFTHGSIADRMEYLHTLSIDPTRTTQFDRTMSILYAVLILALLVCGATVMIAMAA